MHSKKIVLGLFGKAENADIAINNLIEAEVGQKDISVIAQDEKTALQLSGGNGKLTGIFSENQLHTLGLSDSTIKQYAEAVQQGGVLLAVSAHKVPEEVLEEMLKDNRGEQVVVIN